MPYAPDHKKKTRKIIVEAARSLFNQRGFVEVSIDDIMAEAGLTRGGFYHHFRNKEALFTEAIEGFSQRTPCQQLEKLGLDQHSPNQEMALQLVNAYLSAPHLQDLKGQCPLAALPSDAARAGKDVRRAYTNLLRKMIDLFQHAFDAQGDQQAEQHGMVLAALCVGGLTLARTVEDPKMCEQLLSAVRGYGTAMVQLPSTSLDDVEPSINVPERSASTLPGRA